MFTAFLIVGTYGKLEMAKRFDRQSWNPWQVHHAVTAHIAVANSIASAGHEQQRTTQPVAITEGARHDWSQCRTRDSATTTSK
jgi:hypothetical protein